MPAAPFEESFTSPFDGFDGFADATVIAAPMSSGFVTTSHRRGRARRRRNGNQAGQLAHNLTRDHITVNAIAPGPFPSKMMAFVLDADGGEATVAKGVPLGRIGTPQDMAGTALFLASRAGSYLTGAIIPVDGGISTR